MEKITEENWEDQQKFWFKVKLSETLYNIPCTWEDFMEKDNGSSGRSSLCMQGLLGVEWPEKGTS